MINVVLLVSYQGTHYYGWQKTYTGKSIEELLQAACEKILQQPVVLQAASRTDRGVHALGQVVNLFCEKNKFNCKKFLLGLNALLPHCIRILDVQIQNENFHPTLDCKAKEYHYQICTEKVQLPQHRFFSWHYPYTLDIEQMILAASHLIAEHDFEAFCNRRKNAKYEHYIRRIDEINIKTIETNRYLISVKGNHFLYKMVRNIIGTLVMVGRNKLQATSIPQLLLKKDRRLIGLTAPACGLTLYKVYY